MTEAPLAAAEVDARLERAIELFKSSPVGQQLSRHEGRAGRCRRASQRFISALRHVGIDGALLEWAWDGEWHNAVLLADGRVVDWTASQFESDPDRIAGVPWPRIETREEAEARWGEAQVIEPDDRWALASGLPRLQTWAEARLPMPPPGTPQAEAFRN